MPADNPPVRNAYVKMMDHRSQAVIQLSSIIRTEALQEKMTLTSSKNFGSNMSNRDDKPDNGAVQRKLFQLLSIIEPILLNDENVGKAINNNFVDTLNEMLIFQSQNLMTI